LILFSFSFFPLPGFAELRGDEKLRACAASAGAINLRAVATKVCGRTGASRRLVEQQPGERAGCLLIRAAPLTLESFLRRTLTGSWFCSSESDPQPGSAYNKNASVPFACYQELGRRTHFSLRWLLLLQKSASAPSRRVLRRIGGCIFGLPMIISR
jgi:hypothetical protein